MSEKNKIKLKHSKTGGEINAVFGDKRKHIPYFWVGGEGVYLGVIEDRRAVQKLKRLCEEFLKRTMKE